MDGGLALAILPLIISAAEHWDDVLRPFKTFIRYAIELDKFQGDLKVQKLIYHNQYHRLMSFSTDPDTARAMLSDRRHLYWTNRELDRNLAQLLDDSLDSCIYLTKSIQLKLKELEKKEESFLAGVKQEFPPGSIGKDCWHSRFAARVRISFSGSSINGLFDELSQLNQRFVTLSKQIIKLQKDSMNIPSMLPVPKTHGETQNRTREKIREFQTVQSAFIELYKVLGTACQIHAEHLAQFCLPAEHMKDEGSDLLLVRFNISFAGGLSSALSTEHPVWTTIITQFQELTTSGHHLRRHLRTGLAELSNLSSLKITQEKANSLPIPMTLADPWLSQFCLTPDFCVRIRKRRACANEYIGYLEQEGPRKHRVFFDRSGNSRRQTSLAQLFSSQAEKNEAQRLLQYEQICLAKQLATAVLQFHATPLLKDSWQSEDIFFDAEEDTKKQYKALLSPNVKVVVRGSHSDSGTPGNLVSLIFNFGIILLELAYQAPLRSLQVPEDLTTKLGIKYANVSTADRLSQNMCRITGIKYADIVKKCLACDFGLGKDLTDPFLQAAFYTDVVCELEALADGLHKRQIWRLN